MTYRYVGPEYINYLYLNDGTRVYPETITTDAEVLTLLAQYPELKPYWRNGDEPISLPGTGSNRKPLERVVSFGAITTFVNNVPVNLEIIYRNNAPAYKNFDWTLIAPNQIQWFEPLDDVDGETIRMEYN
jgi:hypothetical protein